MSERHVFILLSGLHHGGWCWAQTMDRLHTLDHRAYAPSYTGVGERRHLLNPSISIETYIDDVMMLLEA